MNKPVFFITFGPSLIGLEENIHKYKDLDVMWASMDDYDLVNKILSKIGKKLSIYGWHETARTENPVQNAEKLFPDIIYYYKEWLPTWERDVGHFTCMIMSILIELKAKNIIIFGLDGGKAIGDINDPCKTHYPGYYKKTCVDFVHVSYDCRARNEHFWEWMLPYGIIKENVNIYNCSSDSLVTCFNKINYDQVTDKYNNMIKGDTNAS